MEEHSVVEFYYRKKPEALKELEVELRLGGHRELEHWTRGASTMHPAQIHLVRAHVGWFTLCGIAVSERGQGPGKQYCIDCLEKALETLRGGAL